MNVSTAMPGGLPAGAHLDLRNTFGALYISGIVSVGLLGITTLQAWFYFRNYPEDGIYTKLLVVVVWSLEFVRSTFVVHGSYYYAILNWGNLPVLTTIVWSMSALPLLTNIVELIVQLYFAWRIWILSRLSPYRWGLPSIVTLMALTNFGAGVAVYSSNLGATSIAAYEGGAQKVLSPLALATSMAANVAIMVALGYLLHRSRSGLTSTDHLINVLMFYIIQAGALIIVVDIAVIILNQYFSRTGLVYIAVYAMLGNLYANSVLASLNARANLRDKHRTDGIISASGPIAWRSHASASMHDSRGATQTGTETVGGSMGLTTEAYQLHLLANAGRANGSESKVHDAKVSALEPLNINGDADSV